MPPAETPTPSPDLDSAGRRPASRPASLGAHEVPPERLEPVVVHAMRLGQAAREIGDALPFAADAADFLAVLESEGA